MTVVFSGRRGVAALIGVAVLGLVGLLVFLGRPEPPASKPPRRTRPAPGGWTAWFDGDFRDKLAEEQGGRLRLRCSTLGSDSATVKTLGMTSAAPVTLDHERHVRAALDWNAQVDGSSLTSALLLAAPTAPAANPLSARDWVKVEYFGAAPGKSGRLAVSVRTAGRDRVLFQEDRPLARQQIELVLKPGGAFDVVENGARIYAGAEPLVTMPAAQVSVLMTSAGNFPSREVFWEGVDVPR